MKLAGLSSFCLVASLLVSLPALAADTTPAKKPSVTDDGSYTSSSTSLHAKWNSSDPESGIVEYQYLIRQDSTSGTIIVNWTSVGVATEVTRAGLSLLNGKSYYFGVKAKNGAGLWSSEGYSNGIKVDASLPSAPGQPTEGSSSTDYDYDADGKYTIYWPAASDPESGIAAYELQEQVRGTGTWTTLTTTTSRSRSVSDRLHNAQYFYRVRAKNGAGLWGSWSPTSDGLLVDKTAPSPVTVTDDGAITSSTTRLHATWTASSDPESGLVDYQYLIRQDSTSGTIIVNWTSVGQATEVTRTGLSLVNGKTYFIGVRAKNGAGLDSSISYSNGIVVQANATPPPPSSYQGFGAETPGGEGQPLYPVTTLNDSGPGSLRDAVSQGNRTVVFDVGGEIVLSSEINVRGAFITVDGFTAPSPITLVNDGLRISGNNGAHDIIVRGIRVRNAIGDSITIRDGAHNVVIDHISSQGASDGAIDITRGAFDITVQWSIIAENAPGHNLLSLIGYGAYRVTFHHNLFMKGQSRNPQSGWDGTAATTPPDTVTDMRNNLIWNFSAYGTIPTDNTKANVVNNFYYSSLQPSADRALHVTNGGKVYAQGNYSQNGANVDGQGNQQAPFPAPPVDATDAITACEQVLANAGVQPLDAIDQQYLSLVSCQ